MLDSATVSSFSVSFQIILKLGQLWAIYWRWLACNQPLNSSAPQFFPHRSLGGRKREDARGGVALWKESYLWAQRGETETLTMRAVGPAERSVSVGFSQAWRTLSVQGSSARLTLTAWHLQQRCAEICSFSEALSRFFIIRHIHNHTEYNQ